MNRVDGSSQDVTLNPDTSWQVRDIPGQAEPITVNDTDSKGLVTAIDIGIGEVVAIFQGFETDLVFEVTAN